MIFKKKYIIFFYFNGIERNRDTAWFSIIDTEWPAYAKKEEAADAYF